MCCYRLFALFCLAVYCCGPLTCLADTPGLSKTKPADGRYVKTDQGYMVPYTQTIPGTDVTFQMTPVPGGEVRLGLRNPGDDEDEQANSPAVTVKLDPYWIGAREVTWAEYWPFMALDTTFSKIGYLRGRMFEGDKDLEKELKKHPELQAAVNAKSTHVDGITAPTPLYDPSTTYYSGDDPQLPAVTMTVYAARQFTKWLSALTGDDYRLPSEAEWEHAARASAEGDLIAESLEEIAWFDDNSDGDTHLVGQKQPNAWGLYDVVGNVAEWVLDAPSSETPQGDQPLDWREAIATPEEQFPRIAKGGFWEAPQQACRFASRLLSVDEDWKASDPNIPLSPWWFTDDPASGVGMRIVRPLKPLDAETKEFVWEIDSPDLQTDVDIRLRKGSGKLQAIDKNLPQVVEQMDDPRMRKLME